MVYDSFRLKSSDELFEFVVERDVAFDYLRVRFVVLVGRTVPLPSETCGRCNLPGIILGFDPIQRIFASERVACETWRRNEDVNCEGDAERVFVDDDARRPLKWPSKSWMYALALRGLPFIRVEFVRWMLGRPSISLPNTVLHLQGKISIPLFDS